VGVAAATIHAIAATIVSRRRILLLLLLLLLHRPIAYIHEGQRNTKNYSDRV